MPKINYQKLKSIIDEWDPIQLFPGAPDDEYIIEINTIYDLVDDSTNVEELVLIIRGVFLKYFKLINVWGLLGRFWVSR
ncbi:hypothetical protein [Marinisporobacter balticus]|uniref:DUF1871 family protein n=1 Tax=Marinisporobacter balticus TaxID=2018667 RepID=A0A4R2L5D8_9FIRM|nr:hypothetical protein [Marinisporobacter balticus]TCO79096.1 hypothetical protein EV214_103148 [Marinisporobacter balticus]